MGRRVGVTLALGGAALLLTGCGNGGTVEAPRPARKAVPASPGSREVTLHVEGMTKRLGLF
jgi:hypothetical protein